MNDIDALSITSQLITAFQKVQSAVEQYESDVAYYDHEYTDLTHALELIPFDAAKGYLLAK